MCFSSSREEAYQAALVDYHQYVIDKILEYKGDPELRTSLVFLVRFVDGSEVWLPFSKDLSEAVQFEEFVRLHRPLSPLLYTVEAWKRIRKESYRRVEGVEVGERCYVDLRAWGSAYFESLHLPEGGKVYVVECIYILFVGRNRAKVDLKCPLFGEVYTWDPFCVYAYGTEKVLTDSMVLVDKSFCRSYPSVLSR